MMDERREKIIKDNVTKMLDEYAETCKQFHGKESLWLVISAAGNWGFKAFSKMYEEYDEKNYR